MPAYEVIDSAPACPLSSVVEEQSWEAPLRYESATNNAFMVSQSNFIRSAGRSDGGNGACHESLPRSGLVQYKLCRHRHSLYSITTNQAAIAALFRVINRYVGNLPPMPGVFSDYPAPVIRNTEGGREMVTMRWC